jgi:predicted secreted protein
MSAQFTRRAGLTAAVSAFALGLVACQPVTMIVDTPKQGDQIALKPNQPMRVRWANLEPSAGAWALEESSAGVVTASGVDIAPPSAGARQLESFNFVAARPGQQPLTFVYKRKDGAAATADDRITVMVKVG